MCCDLLVLCFHFYVVYYLYVKCALHLIEKQIVAPFCLNHVKSLEILIEF